MSKMIIRDYYTGDRIKSITVKTEESVSYQIERNTRTGAKSLVIRDYYTGDMVQRIRIPAGRSISYSMDD